MSPFILYNKGGKKNQYIEDSDKNYPIRYRSQKVEQVYRSDWQPFSSRTSLKIPLRKRKITLSIPEPKALLGAKEIN
ncbi:hypothetical protein TNCT_70971 [Trichonephila clavata]|uniref:Uncharacterized protein n=1 Tax=Trichonephila clavata TaxID=2740835 RepID=A0A8X6KYQ3_TRICU|nr:hypothetical protein TNCT_70971 [Trichonephila clavata]